MNELLVLICELTHRCPLRCAYCSNPRELVRRDAELDTATWSSVLEQAAALGVLQVHLSGGEPLLRADLPAIVATAGRLNLYATLITSGLGAGGAGACLARLDQVVGAGLRAVQVSFQDTDAGAAVAVAGRRALDRKLEFARHVRALGASLTVNFVLHRGNLERLAQFIELAVELGADRVELAHTQYHGWAALNRLSLSPSPAQVEAADRAVARALRRHAGVIEIVYVTPEAGRAKACMGGWGQRAMVIDPEGAALPCHAATSLPLVHDNVRERSLAAIWADGPSFRVFRGESWMEEPCRSCAHRAHDFGGCRCRAFAQTGRMTATDPACPLSPDQGQPSLSGTGDDRGDCGQRVTRIRALGRAVLG